MNHRTPTKFSGQKEIPEAHQEPLSTDNRQPITDNHSAIYLAPFYYAELGVANQFLRLLASDQGHSTALLSPNSTPFLTQLESEMGIRFASQQREAIHTAMTTRAMILTGGPGTGKTTTVVGMIRLFGAEGRRITLTAPTGRAANVSARQPAAKPKPFIGSLNSRRKTMDLSEIGRTL